MSSRSKEIGPVSVAIAAELRADLARAHMNKRDAARLSGIPYDTLRKLLVPDRIMDVEQLSRLCSALGIDVHDVVHRPAVVAAGTADTGSGQTAQQIAGALLTRRLGRRTPAWLAEHANVPPSTVKAMLDGTGRKPSRDAYRRVEPVLGLPPRLLQHVLTGDVAAIADMPGLDGKVRAALLAELHHEGVAVEKSA